MEFLPLKKKKTDKCELWFYDLVQNEENSKLAQLFSVDALTEKNFGVNQYMKISEIKIDCRKEGKKNLFSSNHQCVAWKA